MGPWLLQSLCPGFLTLSPICLSLSVYLSICFSHVANRQFCPLSPHLQVIQGWVVLSPS